MTFVSLSSPPPLTHLARRVLVIYLLRTCVYQPLRRPRQSQATVAHFCFHVLPLSSDGLTKTELAVPSFVFLVSGFCIFPRHFRSLQPTALRLATANRSTYASTPPTSVLAIAGRLLVSPMPQDSFAFASHPSRLSHCLCLTVQRLSRVLARSGSRPVSSRTIFGLTY